jgi:hypothetical protein
MSPTIPPRLLDAIKNRRCVLFAGAGLSSGEDLPNWGGLLIELLQRAVDEDLMSPAAATTLRKAVRRDRKYLFVADVIKRTLGPRGFDDQMERIFRNPALKPTRRHELITRIPFLAVITTNYDKLLESAYARHGYIPPTYTFRDAPDVISAVSQEKFFILKAHGDIDHKDSIVLSEKSYRDVLYREPAYRAALNTIFIAKTVLFIGAGLGDTDVKLVLESVSESFSGSGPTHYALVPAKDAVDEEAAHWREFFGMQLIRYRATKDHPEVDEFLQDLADHFATEHSPEELTAATV